MSDRMIQDQLERLRDELVQLRERRDEALAARAAGGGGDVEALDIRIAQIERLAASLVRSLETFQAANVSPADATIAGPGAVAAVRKGEKRARDEEEESSLTFAKRTAIRYPSQKVVRYNSAFVRSKQKQYETVFNGPVLHKEAQAFILASVGIDLLDQMTWAGRILDDMRKRNLDAVEGEVIGSTLAFLFVLHRLTLHGNQVDGERIAPEHAMALVEQLQNAEPTFQFTRFRYWSPQYFEDAIRALRRGESAEEAANFLLLG
jgi:hypothetical protein